MNLSAQTIYEQLKSPKKKYDEAKHCALVLEIFKDRERGTVSAFCKEALISDTTFYRWTNEYPIFNECYRVGMQIARENWEQEGRDNRENKAFNMQYWSCVGNTRYGIGKAPRVRLDLDPEGTPYDHFKAIMKHAAAGEMSATEVKLCMEALNAGTRTYEAFEIQKQVDQLKADAQKAERKHGEFIIPDRQVTQDDSGAVPN